MSKDEYLITDEPLKALTVFAMPMILGSFFQQVYNMADSIIVGQFVGSSALAAVGACAALTNVFICIALGGRRWCRCTCEPLFWIQRLQQNENNRINIIDQFPDSKYTSGRLWILLFPFDDEFVTDTC